MMFPTPLPVPAARRRDRWVRASLALGTTLALALAAGCGGGKGAAPSAPTLTTQPAGTTVVAGSPATFTVGASGASLAYQWLRNGAAVTSGGTGTTFTLAAPAAADDMARYTVRVSNPGGSVTSGEAVLHVNHITLGSQPTGGLVGQGRSATLVVTATGAQGAALSYQWQKDGADVSGATAAAYTVADMAAAQVGTYHCRITATLNGTTAQATSQDATLSLVNAPVIASQPADLTVAEGSPATLSVAATGDALSYQWKKGGVAIAGATSPSLVLPATTPADTASYSCTVTNTANGVAVVRSTAPALLFVVGAPTFTQQPSGLTVLPGQPATLRATATATATLSYQWLKNGAPLPGATQATYAIASAAAADAGTYTCRAFNTANGVSTAIDSQGAELVVQLWPVITSQPGNRTVMAGDPATFRITATGLNLTYAWIRNGSPIPGATQASYTVNPTTLANDGDQYWCVVTNGNQPDATSAHATLTVTPAATGLRASATTLSQGEGVILTYTFGLGDTATLQEGTGSPVPVTRGGKTLSYPTATTTYTLAVTSGGLTTPYALDVAVKTYTPTSAYVTGYGSNDLRRYPVTAGATPNIGEATATLPTGSGPIHVVARPDEKFLYVANHLDHSLSAFSVDPATGALASLGATTPLAAYTSPWASAVSPDGSHLYVACTEGVEVFALDAATGAPTPLPALATALPGRAEGDLLMHPSGRFLFVLDHGHAKLLVFAVDATTGALTFVSDAVTPASPQGLTFDRSANRLYTRGTHADPQIVGTLSTYELDPYTGDLTLLGDYAGFGVQPNWTQKAGQTITMPYVRGRTLSAHGLAFTRKPGADRLLNVYDQDSFAGLSNGYFTYMSEYTLGANGLITGDYNNPDWGLGSPYYFSSMGIPYGLGAAGIAGDRSGSFYIVPIKGMDSFVTWYCSDAGVFKPLTNFSGELTRASGQAASHACFVGTLQ